MRKRIHRTIRHDDGSKIQTHRSIVPLFGDTSAVYVRYQGRLMGTLALCMDGVEVRPLMGEYSTGIRSVSEGARMLVRTNGGFK